ncbi:MAG: HAD hydrolase family protein [Bacteroidia bacterium]|nr:HAD hydrolase family protein [Bacteroidia bacterium]
MPSRYAEADSMGTNLLRYYLWKRNQQMPYVGIITGAVNPTAVQLAQRERFHAIYSQIKDKGEAFQHFCNVYQLKPEQVVCWFDDANDLAMAQKAGLRILIRRKSTPMFTDFVKKNKLCDYVTAAEGGNYAVREVCELLLTLGGALEEVLLARMELPAPYRIYSQLRAEIEPRFYKKESENILQWTLP